MIEVDVSIGGARVCRILDRVFLTRPLPETLIVDNVLYTEHKQKSARTVRPPCHRNGQSAGVDKHSQWSSTVGERC